MGAVISKLVFRPPAHPTYSDVDGKMLFIRRMKGEKKGEIMEEDLIYLTTIHGNTIPAVYMQQPGATKTILYSHANMEDLGLSARFCSEMSHVLGVNIFVYDYSGYGLSTGKPSEKNLYADIQAAYKYLLVEKELKPEDIVVMGRSVGSGPSVDLASKKQVGGLVLVCPLTSCVRVMKKVSSTPSYDMFPNIDKIHKVRCHVLLVHGKKDKTVPFEHGVQLFRKARCAAKPLWIEKGDHNDLETDFKLLLLERYKEFINHLDDGVEKEAIDIKTEQPKIHDTRTIDTVNIAAERNITLRADYESGELLLNLFDSGKKSFLYVQSIDQKNYNLSRMTESSALVIVFNFMTLLKELAGEDPEAIDIQSVEECDFGMVSLPDEDGSVGSWMHLSIDAPNCFSIGSYLAGVLLYWLISGQEAFAVADGVDSLFSGKTKIQSGMSTGSGDCKLIAKRLLNMEGSRRITLTEATAHRLFIPVGGKTRENSVVSFENDAALSIHKSQFEESNYSLGSIRFDNDEQHLVARPSLGENTKSGTMTFTMGRRLRDAGNSLSHVTSLSNSLTQLRRTSEGSIRSQRGSSEGLLNI